MISKWHLLYCDQNSEACPVVDFIDACAPKHQVKILRFLSLLEDQGPTLPRPYADILVDGIHELRIKLSGDHIRLLYFFCYRKFIVMHSAFVKNTSQVPEKRIREVKQYREDFLDRISEVDLEEIIHADI